LHALQGLDSRVYLVFLEMLAHQAGEAHDSDALVQHVRCQLQIVAALPPLLHVALRLLQLRAVGLQLRVDA
jgi:hypothetical protein